MSAASRTTRCDTVGVRFTATRRRGPSPHPAPWRTTRADCRAPAPGTRHLAPGESTGRLDRRADHRGWPDPIGVAGRTDPSSDRKVSSPNTAVASSPAVAAFRVASAASLQTRKLVLLLTEGQLDQQLPVPRTPRSASPRPGATGHRDTPADRGTEQRAPPGRQHPRAPRAPRRLHRHHNGDQTKADRRKLPPVAVLGLQRRTQNDLNNHRAAGATRNGKAGGRSAATSGYSPASPAGPNSAMSTFRRGPRATCAARLSTARRCPGWRDRTGGEYSLYGRSGWRLFTGHERKRRCITQARTAATGAVQAVAPGQHRPGRQLAEGQRPDRVRDHPDRNGVGFRVLRVFRLIRAQPVDGSPHCRPESTPLGEHWSSDSARSRRSVSTETHVHLIPGAGSVRAEPQCHVAKVDHAVRGGPRRGVTGVTGVTAVISGHDDWCGSP